MCLTLDHHARIIYCVGVPWITDGSGCQPVVVAICVATAPLARLALSTVCRTVYILHESLNLYQERAIVVTVGSKSLSLVIHNSKVSHHSLHVRGRELLPLNVESSNFVRLCRVDEPLCRTIALSRRRITCKSKIRSLKSVGCAADHRLVRLHVLPAALFPRSHIDMSASRVATVRNFLLAPQTAIGS